MNVPLPVAVESAAALPLFASQSTPDVGSALFAAATALAQSLRQGLALDARSLRAAMETAFDGSEADGSWSWKLTDDACEAARRVMVTSVVRVELTGFTDGMVERLKAIGLISETIAWRLRLFVPIGFQGPTVLAALLERYRLTRVSERAAA